MNISVIGGDLRQLTLARLLKEEGENVKIAGFSKGPENFNPDPLDIWQSDIVILPIPASHDGITVNAPFSEHPIYLTPKNLKTKPLILGGNISKELKELLNDLGVPYIDYLTREVESSILRNNLDFGKYLVNKRMAIMPTMKIIIAKAKFFAKGTT